MNSRAVSLRRIFILLLCQWTNIVDGTLIQFVNYVWKTGSWSECSNPSGCGEGVQTRNVWCSDVNDDRTTLGTNCDPELKPPENQTCFVPCKRHRNSIRWKVGNWGDCLPNKPSWTDCDGGGWQERSVQCVRSHNRSSFRTIKESNCMAFHSKPTKERSCILKCPQDCILSSFGNWSSCGVCGSVNRTRIRFVLVAPKDGGEECSHLTEFRECSVYTDCLRDVRVGADFVLKIAPWSPCIARKEEGKSSSRQPVVGYRKRNVICLDKMGEVTDSRRCKNQSVTLVESCVVAEDCHVTEWSEWILVKTGCVTSTGKIHPEIKERRRKVIRLAEGDGASCPHLTEKRRLVDKLPPCIRLYNWSISTWNECQPYRNWCGGGLQTRNVFCVRLEDYIPVGEVFCKEPKPSSVQQCNFECPTDCWLSSWSSWGACLPLEDKDSGKSYGGYRQRRREIVRKPSEDRSECPALVQVDSCVEPTVVKWSTGNWSKCLLRDATQPCGEGVRNREAVCVTPAGMEVSSSLCQRYVLPPKLIAPCYIPCPRDCVLAEWTEWSDCSTDCTNSTLIGKRSRRRNVLAKEGPGGKPCPDSDTLTESEFCSYDSCSGFNWEKSDWSLCRVPRNRTCGKGIRNRYVNCLHENTLVPDEKCMPEPKPSIQKSCFVPCPIDCVTSNFTEWTSCPSDCKPGSVQRRKRYILQHSRHGGTACPQSLEETRSCHSEHDGCKRLEGAIPMYGWDIGSWSLCVLTEGATCGRGHQTRRVVCVRYDGKKVIVHNCLSSTEKPPPAERVCYVSCNDSCSLSEWSSWSLRREKEINNCLQQMRTREIIGRKCDDPVLNETRASISPEILIAPEGHWSKCVIDEESDSTCGNGKKYIRGNQVNSCQQTGLTWDMCLVECPESCQLSEWTQWSQCNVTCGQGYKRRQRHVVKYGNKMGRPCPVLNGDSEIQESICQEDCEEYKWIFRGWSECKVISAKEDCGKGVQTTVVRCSKISKSTSQIVDGRFCVLSKPVESISCYVPCPDDCVVSIWSSWTQCSEPCNNLQHRYRNRTVLRMALPSSGRKCPTLTEEEACHRANCFFYKWKIGKWSSCILPEDSSCGWGTSGRAINCQRNDGTIVGSEHCSQLKVHSISTSCFVECPIDCEMSKWSSWNDNECKPCSSKGERWRTRTTIQEPSKTGKPCPSDVIQRMPCSHQPCYHWSLGEWSNCLTNEEECGYGITKREANCKRSDGATVHKSYCLTINVSESIAGWTDERWLEEVFDVQETKVCYVPCPQGCILTSWSPWSPCHRNCLKHEIVGYRTRSRAVLVNATGKHETCPKKLWEKSPCWDGPCLTYGWKLKNNVILCVRTDGVIVEGGCEKRLRPCYPECSAPDSFCDHALGQCVCPVDASPVYDGRTEPGSDVGPHLLRCLPNVMDRLNVTRSEDDIVLRYFPDDNEFSFWMYAMICAGSAFVIFVVVTLYLMCIEKPSARQQEPSRALHMKTYYR